MVNSTLVELHRETGFLFVHFFEYWTELLFATATSATTLIGSTRPAFWIWFLFEKGCPLRSHASGSTKLRCHIFFGLVIRRFVRDERVKNAALWSTKTRWSHDISAIPFQKFITSVSTKRYLPTEIPICLLSDIFEQNEHDLVLKSFAIFLVIINYIILEEDVKFVLWKRNHSLWLSSRNNWSISCVWKTPKLCKVCKRNCAQTQVFYWSLL